MPSKMRSALVVLAALALVSAAGCEAEEQDQANGVPENTVGSEQERTEREDEGAVNLSEEEIFSLKNRHADIDTAINAGNVASLTQAWMAATDDLVTGAPLVHNDSVFFADWSGTVYSAKADTGEILWKKKVEQPKDWPWHGLAGPGELANGTLYYASVEGNLFALDPETGELKWQTAITDQDHAGSLAPPLYYDGLLYVGLQSVEEPLTAKRQDFVPNFQGHVKAFDADTGELVWDTQLVEEPHNGVPVWAPFALDPASGRLFFGTGNNYTGEATANSDSLIAVDAKTGKIAWSRQVYQHDVWTPTHSKGPDYDFGAGPQLFEASIDGKQRNLVGIGSKSGVFFAFDRETGEPVYDTVVGYGGVGGGIRGEASIGRGTVYAWSNNFWDDVGRAQPLPPQERPITVKAFDAATGKLKWVQDKVQPAIGWSAGFLADDVYFVGSLDGTIQAFRAQDGTILAKLQAPSSVASSLVVENDTLLVGTGVPKTFGGLPGTSGVIAYRAK